MINKILTLFSSGQEVNEMLAFSLLEGNKSLIPGVATALARKYADFVYFSGMFASLYGRLRSFDEDNYDTVVYSRFMANAFVPSNGMIPMQKVLLEIGEEEPEFRVMFSLKGKSETFQVFTETEIEQTTPGILSFSEEKVKQTLFKLFLKVLEDG
jgi:hypothetical protein